MPGEEWDGIERRKDMSINRLYALFVELKEHLYGDTYGDQGDIPHIKKHLENLNGDMGTLPCKNGSPFGCLSRKKILLLVITLLIALVGGGFSLDRLISIVFASLGG